MERRFKIHPAIGIARVGKSSDGFFLSGETPGATPLEVGATADEDFRGYKDAHHLMRRQAARFRVYEYKFDAASGEETFVGELDPDRFTVHWEVQLGNRKAASKAVQPDRTIPLARGARVMMPSANDRNTPPTGMSLEDLAGSVMHAIHGKNTIPADATLASIGGVEVDIGQVRTDHSGRLVVVPGPGDAGTFAPGFDRLNSFANNPGWFDDVADGSVDAKIEENGVGMLPAPVAGAWIIAGPPDFAPDVAPVVTMYDIVIDAFHRTGSLNLPQPLSYTDDIFPIIERAARVAMVNEVPALNNVVALLEAHGGNLGDKSPAGQAAREAMFEQLVTTLETDRDGLSDFRYPPLLLARLRAWRDGNFERNSPASRPAKSEAELLDRASLESAIGGGFFPGIEAGFILTESSLYTELGRISRGTFDDHDGSKKNIEPGFLTERMALPWHADFHDCNGNWWPASRPDISRFNEDGDPEEIEWARGVESDLFLPPARKRMVDHFAQLGVIFEQDAGSQNRQVESGRDPGLST